MDQNRLRFVWWNSTLSLFCLVVSGCGGGSPQTERPVLTSPVVDSSVGTGAQTVADASKPTKSVNISRRESDISPTATQAVELDEGNPSEVCQRFLDLLKNGNRIGAENLLTRPALTVTGKAGLVLEPIGGPNSRFDVKTPRFASINNEVAYVDCEVTEFEKREESRFTVTWLLKKSNSKWRIAGLLADLDEGKPMKLLSFENPSDVEDIKRRSAENLSPLEARVGSETRQADLSNSGPGDQRK